ncbi:MAG TPA: hypothetical protein VLO30_05075 [Chthoniobacterales bacterium]|nr:hypothetical protein [Chthoniobacterales bacterium]
MKRVLAAVTALLGLCQGLPAQSPQQLFYGPSALDSSVLSPWASLENRNQFFFSTAFGSMRNTPEFLPAFDPSAPLSTAYVSPTDNKSSVDRIVGDLHAPGSIRYGGEIGFLYGKSTGSGFGREDFAGYVIGTVGNDKFSITAGYYRQETTYSGQRWRR